MGPTLKDKKKFSSFCMDSFGFSRFEAEHMFRVMDFDDSGQLSQAEFLAAMQMSDADLCLEAVRHKVRQRFQSIRSIVETSMSNLRSRFEKSRELRAQVYLRKQRPALEPVASNPEAERPPSAAERPPPAAERPPSAAERPPSAGERPPSAGERPSSAAERPPADMADDDPARVDGVDREAGHRDALPHPTRPLTFGNFAKLLSGLELTKADIR